MAIELPNKETEAAERVTEEQRRKDINAENVGQEALDCVAELEAAGRSPSEAFTVYGYSLSHVVKRAQAEEKRIVVELKSGPSKDVTSSILTVSDVKTKHAIEEYVEPVKEEVSAPVVIEG